MHCPWWIIAFACSLILTNDPSVYAQAPSRSSPSFTLKPKNFTQIQHSIVTFECRAVGAPTPTINWVKYTDSGETLISSNARFVIGAVSRYLSILGIYWSDAGRYGCVAQNKHGRIVADAYLTVISEGPPTWQIKPYNVTLYSGQKYTLPCRTHGYPAAFHTWTKDGSPVPGHGVTAGINDLLFSEAKISHSGMYTCTAYNVYGHISQTVFVKVFSDPSVVIHPAHTSTARGAPVTLSCGVVGSENSLTVKWKRNGSNLPNTWISFKQQTWQNVHYYYLIISKLRKSLLGRYRCVVTNSKGSVTSNMAKVSFSGLAIPLTVKVAEPVVIAEKGSDVEIQCIFIGNLVPEVTWYKDGHKLPNKGFQVTIPLNHKFEAILKLSSITSSLGGNYTCKGSSKTGYAEGNISVIVKGGSAPKVKPISSVKVAKRDTKVILQFVVMATVIPDVTWYKDGEELYNVTSLRQNSNSTFHTELAIPSVQYKDSGFYTCVVQNQFGVSSGNVTLAVKGSPEVPTNVSVKQTSPDTVVVSWVPGFSGGAQTTFTVQFKESGSNTWMSAAENGINATSAEFKNSEGWGGSFVFRVTAVNQFGSSEYSEVSVELKGKNVSQQHRTEGKSSTGAIVGGITGGLLFVALIIFLVLVLRRLRKKKKALPKQLPTVTYAVVDEQNNTYDGTYTDATGTPRESCDTYSYVSIRPDAVAAMATGNDQYASIHRPKQWEIPKRNVRLDKTLGSGHFGQVMKGFLKTKQGMQVVAVKMLKDNADKQQKKEFLAELELMKTMAPHPNIVGLVACATKSDQPFIIVEYCSMGNLRDFLRSSHGSVVYANMAGNSLTLTCRDLLSFGWQCARGMSYLSSQKLVHRDLAARNILVDKGHVCKIADFGLARDIYEKKQYLKLGEAELPLRWMAIESIFQGITTTESDIWSFGILLWEIVTLGANPYPGLSRDDLIEQLRLGYRMPKPPFCSDELYSIMWQCWQQDPQSRATFLELGKTLHRLMTAQTLSIDLGNYDRSYINATEEEQ